MNEQQITLDRIEKDLVQIGKSLEKIAAYLKHVPEAIGRIDLGYEKEGS